MDRLGWIMEQLDLGRTFQSIGNELGISRQRVHQIATEEGLLPDTYKIRRERVMADVAILHAAGMNDSEIARGIARAHSGIQRIRQRLGLNPMTRALVLLQKGLGFCTKCRETKPTAGFPRDAGNRSGLHSWCRACCVRGVQRWRKRKQEERCKKSPPSSFVTSGPVSSRMRSQRAASG